MFENIKTFLEVMLGFVCLIVGIVCLIPATIIWFVSKILFLLVVTALYVGFLTVLHILGATYKETESVRNNYYNIVEKI